LLDLRVRRTSNVKVGINLGEDINSYIIDSLSQSLNENDLQVGIENVGVIILVVRASLSSTSDVGISHVDGLGDVLSGEIKNLRRKSRLIDPSTPVHLRQDIVDLVNIIILVLNICFPSISELRGLNRSLRVVQNVLSEHLLHIVFSNQGL
jgi:hypothetical protein